MAGAAGRKAVGARGGSSGSATVSRSVLVKADARAVWGAVSRIMEIGEWVAGVRSVEAETQERSGVGAGRAIAFEDGSVVRERVVGWVEGRHVSYIMLDGLPLDSYHATISVSPEGRRAARVTWRSHLGASPQRGGLDEAAASIGALYSESLAGLKRLVEGRAR